MIVRFFKQLKLCFPTGVLVFFAFLYLFGVFGLILLPCINNDLRTDLCQCCSCGLDSFSASVKAFLYLVVAFVVLFALIGIVIAVLATTGVIQRSWQRHYHILTKRELTQVIFIPHQKNQVQVRGFNCNF